MITCRPITLCVYHSSACENLRVSDLSCGQRSLRSWPSQLIKSTRGSAGVGCITLLSGPYLLNCPGGLMPNINSNSTIAP